MRHITQAMAALWMCFCLSPFAFAAPSAPRAEGAPKSEIKVLYDAFGKKNGFKKDWGYAAIVEIGGKKILFDTGNNADIFEHNVKEAKVDLATIDFVVMSHRHSDHMAGLSKVIAANPKVKIFGPKEGFGIYGASLPSAFYRKDPSLPPESRYYDGTPPVTMEFGTAWDKANFQTIDQTTEIAPGVWAIALVSDVAGTRELKELSLAIDTPNGLVVLVGCSHPGILNIVQAAAKIKPQIHLIAGGFHLVTAADETIAQIATALRDQWQVAYIAPGHCTGEPTFNALRKAFGDRYVYAGLGTTLHWTSDGKVMGMPSTAALFDDDELRHYQQMAAESHDARDTELAHAEHAHDH
jgi:7,8-dihydropterin-6-yl-methyl-4-(beta-D-ribofuranosyl)aminobenzene 5'-phosphate synthase